MTAFYGVELPTAFMLGTAQYPSPAILGAAFRESAASVATVSVRREAAGAQAGEGFLHARQADKADWIGQNESLVGTA